MSERFWFVGTDEERPEKYQPVLQTPPLCLGLDIWFSSEEACKRFIQNEILLATEMK